MGIGLTSLQYVIGLESLCHPLDQSGTSLIKIECGVGPFVYFQRFRLSASFFLLVIFGILLYFLYQSSFQLSIKSDAGLLWFCFTSLCDWSKKLVSQSQPIKCKTKTKHDLVTRVFPRFKEVACFYSVFSLANNHGNLFSDWQLSSQLDLVFRYSIEKC